MGIKTIIMLVAVLFGILAVFILSSGVTNILFYHIRRAAFFIVMFTIVLLKLRMIGQVIEYIDLSKLYTVRRLFCVRNRSLYRAEDSKHMKLSINFAELEKTCIYITDRLNKCPSGLCFLVLIPNRFLPTAEDFS